MAAFFFKGSGDHRDLPSSPPRRSSDLFMSPGASTPVFGPCTRLDYELEIGAVIRSEEHTSELQSQSKLGWRPFFLKDRATTEIYPLPLPAALPICSCRLAPARQSSDRVPGWTMSWKSARS